MTKPVLSKITTYLVSVDDIIDNKFTTLKEANFYAKTIATTKGTKIAVLKSVEVITLLSKLEIEYVPTYVKSVNLTIN